MANGPELTASDNSGSLSNMIDHPAPGLVDPITHISPIVDLKAGEGSLLSPVHSNDVYFILDGRARLVSPPVFDLLFKDKAKIRSTSTASWIFKQFPEGDRMSDNASVVRPWPGYTWEITRLVSFLHGPLRGPNGNTYLRNDNMERWIPSKAAFVRYQFDEGNSYLNTDDQLPTDGIPPGCPKLDGKALGSGTALGTNTVPPPHTSVPNDGSSYTIRNISNSTVTLHFSYAGGIVPENGDVIRDFEPGTERDYVLHAGFPSITVAPLDSGFHWTNARGAFVMGQDPFDLPSGTYFISK